MANTYSYHVANAKYIGDYKIFIEFKDGAKGEINLENALDIEVLKPLKDKKLFSQFEVNPIFKTITWCTGADISPEYLRENIN